jgi:hypothetical protein
MTLDTNCLLVGLTIRSWGAEAKDRKVTREVADNHGVASSVGRYTKKLIDCPIIKTIQQIASRARLDHYFLTLPWSQEGTRILPAQLWDTWAEKFHANKLDYDEQVDLFIADYTGLIAEAEVRLNGLFNAADYPPVEEIRHRFSFEKTVSALPNANDFRVQLSRTDVDQIKADIAAQTKTAISDAMSNTVERMKNVVEHMIERLTTQTGGKAAVFRDTLVENVRDLVAIVPKLNVVGNPEMDRMAREMEDKLCRYDADALREDATLRISVADEAAAIYEKLKAMGG